MLHIGSGPALAVADITGELFVIRIQQEKSSIPFDLELFVQGLVLRLDLCRELFFSREIHFHKNEVLLRIVLEFLFGEDFFLKLDAPSAPIGTGEVDEDRLVLSLRLRLRCFEIVKPARLPCDGRGGHEHE